MHHWCYCIINCVYVLIIDLWMYNFFYISYTTKTMLYSKRRKNLGGGEINAPTEDLIGQIDHI